MWVGIFLPNFRVFISLEREESGMAECGLEYFYRMFCVFISVEGSGMTVSGFRKAYLESSFISLEWRSLLD